MGEKEKTKSHVILFVAVFYGEFHGIFDVFSRLSFWSLCSVESIKINLQWIHFDFHVIGYFRYAVIHMLLHTFLLGKAIQ